MSHRILFCSICVLIASAWAAPPDGNAPRTGPISSVTTSLTLRWNAQMPAGALIGCRARVVPLGPGAIAGPAEASAKVPGGGAQCALEIPLAWQGSAPPAAIAVIYELDVQSATGKVAQTGEQTIVFPHAAGSNMPLTLPM